MRYNNEDNSGRESVVQTDTAPDHNVTKDDEMAASKRTTSPAFQFYPKEFLSSSKVIAMTATERGVYITLLSMQWLDGSLPNDLAVLARLNGINVKAFARMWPHNLGRCFVEKNGRLYNRRLEGERRKQAEYRARQVEHGKKGGRRVAFPDPSLTLKGSPSPRDADADRKLQSEDLSSGKKEKRLDVAFLSFQSAYPSARRKGGYLVQQAFIHQCGLAGGPSSLMAALENHKASEQWQTSKHVPGMDTWLAEERWRQELPAVEAPQKLAVGGRPLPAWAQKK